MLVAILASTIVSYADPEPPLPTLKTRWSALVDREHPHDEYPRPQLVRERWMNLNGTWDYAIKAMDAGLDFPAKADGQILVPFPLESQLSGVRKTVTKDQRLLYRRTFALPPTPDRQRVILHFEAVDWGTKVFVNGADVGDHTGGYEPFSFDITDRIRQGENELVITVWDPCDEPGESAGGYEPPRGKQVRKPSGIWYTSVTGIWQTVWIEWVPDRAIERVDFEPELLHGTLAITPKVTGEVGDGAKVEVALRWPDNPDGPPIAHAFVAPNTTTTIDVPNVQPWTPESPKLYRVDLHYGADVVRSYVAFRTVAVVADKSGYGRFMLNGKPYFMLGLLDQGWWPDGLYTAPTHDAMIYDIEVTKALGFNTIRKHVKIEPATWYAACDRLGIIVWQDMPSSGPYIGPSDHDAQRGEKSAAVYESELTSMIDRLSFFQSIVMWVTFNEGWGQFDTGRIAKLAKRLDPTRLVNSASGWTDRGFGDMHDIHDYAASLEGKAPLSDSRRINVFGEFGGLGLPVAGHIWREKGWGYQQFDQVAALEANYARLVNALADQSLEGVCGAIYTQTTDVETELNGLMTYDRDVIKPNAATIERINREAIAHALSTANATLSTVVPCALDEQVVAQRPKWRYQSASPLPESWFAKDFDDSKWPEGPSGFGTEQTPGSVMGTQWTTNAIAIRRHFTLDSAAKPTHLFVHHDEDAEVYVDGTLIAKLPGYTTAYARIQLTPEALALLTPGDHVLAVKCTQSKGGQYIDAGLVRVAVE